MLHQIKMRSQCFCAEHWSGHAVFASSESDHLLIWHDSHPSNDLDQWPECWDKRCAVMKQIKVILSFGLGELVRQTDGVLRHILTTYIVCEDNRNTTYLPRMERGKDDERII